MEKLAPFYNSAPHTYMVATGPFFDKCLHYLSKSPLEPGSLVIVPMSGKQCLGVILNEHLTGEASSDQSLKQEKLSLKYLIEAQPNKTPYLNQADLKLFKWACSYYAGTFEQTLQCFAGHQVVKKRLTLASLTKAGLKHLSSTTSLFEEDGYGQAKAKLESFGFSEKNIEPISMNASQKESAERLEKEGFLSLQKRTKLQFKVFKKKSDEKIQKAKQREHKFTLNKSQSLVFESLARNLHTGFEVQALHGITGSGKTEVYLKCIEQVLAQDSSAQVLLLIPEISLSPQTAARIEKVFPNKVAITHSQMTPKQRFEAFHSIAVGSKKILVGPRSNVFAKFENLKYIVVDEEHDTSYKQTTGLCYQARDVAIKRGHLIDIPVLLGSATPSIETLQNCDKQRYQYQTLDHRHKNTPLPKVEVVKNTPAFQVFKRISETTGSDKPPLSQRSLEAIRDVLSRGKQAMVIQGRRGVSHYIYNKKTSEVLQCTQCSVSLTLHSNDKLLCHYCGRSTSLRSISRQENHHDFFAIGAGTQSLEAYLEKELEGARIGRLDSDATAKKGVLEESLKSFRSGETDILVGTQMLAKGHDFPGIDLVVMVDLDQSLLYPDFRANENTVQTIVQAAGRSGRGDEQGLVIIESSNPEHWVFDYIKKHEYRQFCEKEITSRELLRYPPFSRATLIEVQSERQMSHQEQNKLMQSLMPCLTEARVRVFGPSQPMIAKQNKRHRIQVLLLSPLADRRQWLSAVRNRIEVPPASRLKVIVDPYNLA